MSFSPRAEGQQPFSTRKLPASVERLRRIGDIVIVAGVLLIPLVIAPSGREPFRVPKDLLMLAESFVLTAVATATVLLERSWHRTRPRAWQYLPILIAGWMTVATMFASHLLLSVQALLLLYAGAVIFAYSVNTLADKPLWYAALPLIPAALNAAMYALQEFAQWDPFRFGIWSHLHSTAFLGNPNYVGVYLVAPATSAMALAICTKKAAYVAASVILGFAVLATQTLTAILAYVVAALVTFLLYSLRAAVVFSVLGTALLISAVLFYPPLAARYQRAAELVQQDRLDDVFSSRFTAYRAAWRMFTDHPLTGVGPGGFAWEYFDYKLAIERESPDRRLAGAREVNFGEAHNDHLQTLAEGGVPAYFLFVVAMVRVASASRKRASADQHVRAQFVRFAAAPLAAGLAVSALAQFPLHLAAVSHNLLYFAALCEAWRRDAT